jgi:ketosteroid isomerase-like protein
MAGAGMYYPIVMDREYSDRFLRTTASIATVDGTDSKSVLHAAFDEVINGNFEAFGEFLTDDAELSICGFESMNGTWRGRESVVAAARTNFGQLGDQKPEIIGMIAQGDNIALLLRESGLITATGQAYSVRVVQWFTFVQGKIKRIEEIIAHTGKGS